MLFSNSKSKPQNLPSILFSQGSKIECDSNHRYLSILIDESLSFANHIQQLVKRLKLKPSFHFRIKSCLVNQKRDWLLPLLCLFWTTVMLYICKPPLKAYMLLTFMELWGSSLVLKHRVITVQCKNGLDGPPYNKQTVTPAYSHLQGNLFLPSYLLSYINQSNAGTYNLLSHDLFLLSVPKVRTELGKKAFRFAARQMVGDAQTFMFP